MDKIKEFRDKNTELDFIAGFIPGIGEAQDAHDFYHAAKNKDFGGMALASLGFLIPGLNANQTKKVLGELGKLSPALKEKGWKVAEDGQSFIRPDGTHFVRNKEGKLTSVESISQNFKDKQKEKIRTKNEKLIQTNIKKFNEEAYNFAQKTGFFLDTDSWQTGIPKGMKLNPEQLNEYVTKTGPTIMKHLDTLIENGLSNTPKTYALRGKKGQWEAYFPESLPLKGKYGEQYKAGWRPVTNLEAELYLIQTSPNAAGKFEITGIPMYRGIKQEMFSDFKKGASQMWYSSNIKNADTYAEKNGMKFFAAPVKTDKTTIKPITHSRVNPSSNSWHTNGQDPISRYIEGDSHSINISEVPLFDDLTKQKGFFTVLGPDVQVKALKGGTGWFDITKSNPLLQWGLPIGLTSLLGMGLLNNNNEKEYQN